MLLNESTTYRADPVDALLKHWGPPVSFPGCCTIDFLTFSVLILSQTLLLHPALKPFPMASDSSSFSFCPFLPLLTLPYTAPLETKILTWFLFFFFLNYRHVRLLPSWKRPTALSEWDSKVIIVIPPCLSRPCIPKLPTQYQLWDRLLDCVCLSMRPYEGDWELHGRQAGQSGRGSMAMFRNPFIRPPWKYFLSSFIQVAGNKAKVQGTCKRFWIMH